MVNPFAGEVTIDLDGEPHTMKLTLGALAELEAGLPDGGFVDLVERFEAGKYSPGDVMALILAGLRGGGWRGRAGDLVAVEIGQGPMAASRAAAELLVRAFIVPGEEA